MLALSWAVLAAPAAAGPGTRALGGCASADSPLNESHRSVDAAATLCLVDAARGLQHLPPLTVSKELTKAAQGHSADEARTGRFGHAGSNGSTIGSRIAAAGYHATLYNEAIAAQSGSGSVPYVDVQMFLSDHGDECSTLLDPDYRQLGVGIAVGHLRIPGHGEHVFSFMTIDFALPRGQQRPSHNGEPAATCPHTPADDAYETAHQIAAP